MLVYLSQSDRLPTTSVILCGFRRLVNVLRVAGKGVGQRFPSHMPPHPTLSLGGEREVCGRPRRVAPTADEIQKRDCFATLAMTARGWLHLVEFEELGG